MKKLLTTILIIITISSNAQITSKEFGKFTPEEIALETYRQDPSATAVVLFDIGKSKFIDSSGGGYNIQFTRTRRVKILSEDFDEKVATVEIPYYQDGASKETIMELQAYTIHFVDGTPRPKKVLATSIFDERINNNWSVKKFVFPDVQKGDILEYEYVFKTPFLFNLPDWEFQNKIPTIYSEYEVRMIPFYEYAFLVQGISRFDVRNSVVDNKKRAWGNVSRDKLGKIIGGGLEFQDYIHTFALKDLPAFKDESYITSINDYITKIDFQLSKINYPQGGTNDIVGTWPALIDDMIKSESFGRFIKSSKKYAKKELEQINLSGQSNQEKAELIVNHVKKNFTWNGYFGKYVTKNSREFITKKEGNSAELNLFLLSLLREAGLNADPVLLSTRNHGKVKYDYPFKHFFNYVIVLVDGKFMSDATETRLPYYQLPVRCFNEKGLIIKEGDVNFIDLKSTLVSSENLTIKIDDIDIEFSQAELDINFQSNGYDALYLKNKFSNDFEELGNFYSNQGTKINVENSLNFDDNKKPYVLALIGKTTFESLGENIVIKPFLSFPFQRNSLTQKKRSYPVDFAYSFEKKMESIIAIPEGYTINTLPESFNLSNDLADINLTYEIVGSTLTATGNYYFKKSIYKASEYSRIKYYIDQIVKRFNTEIILEKK